MFRMCVFPIKVGWCLFYVIIFITHDSPKGLYIVSLAFRNFPFLKFDKFYGDVP